MATVVEASWASPPILSRPKYVSKATEGGVLTSCGAAAPAFSAGMRTAFLRLDAAPAAFQPASSRVRLAEKQKRPEKLRLLLADRPGLRTLESDIKNTAPGTRSNAE